MEYCSGEITNSALWRRATYVWSITFIAYCPTVSFSNAESFSWIPISVNVENFSLKNSIPGGPNVKSSCSPIQGQEPESSGSPPNVSLFGKLQLANGATGVVWSPDGRYIATSEKFDQIVKIWSFPNLHLLHSIDKGEPGVLTFDALSFSKDGKFLLTSSDTPYSKYAGNSFSLINPRTGRVVQNILGHESPPRHPADQPYNATWSIDGKYLYVQFSSDVWDEYVYNTQNWKIIDKIFEPAITMDAGPDMDSLSLIHYSNLTNSDLSTHRQSLEIFNEPLHRILFNSIFLDNKFPIKSMSFDRYGCFFAFGSFRSSPDDGVRIWNVQENLMFKLPATTPVMDLSVSYYTKLVGYIGGDNKYHLLYFQQDKSGYSADSIKFSDLKSPFSFAISADGHFLATAGDSEVIIYQVKNK